MFIYFDKGICYFSLYYPQDNYHLIDSIVDIQHYTYVLLIIKQSLYGQSNV